MRVLAWADSHPRCAWVLALSAHLNLILTLWVFH